MGRVALHRRACRPQRQDSGIIPFGLLMDSRRGYQPGSSARFVRLYLSVRTPDRGIPRVRKPSGDFNASAELPMAADTDEFIEAVAPARSYLRATDGTERAKVYHRSLFRSWETARNREPYILFIDQVKRRFPSTRDLASGLTSTCAAISPSRPAATISAPSAPRSALSSLSLKHGTVDRRKSSSSRTSCASRPCVSLHRPLPPRGGATYSAERERPVGLGVMGFHISCSPGRRSSAMPVVEHAHLHQSAPVAEASMMRAQERGPAPTRRHGRDGAFSFNMAIAPTASSRSSPAAPRPASSRSRHITPQHAVGQLSSITLPGESPTKSRTRPVVGTRSSTRRVGASPRLLTTEEKYVYKTSFGSTSAVGSSSPPTERLLDQAQSLNL